MKTTRRGALRAAACLAVAEKFGDGGLVAVSSPGRPVRTVPVLPPGAQQAAAFAEKCIACGLCMAVCPEKILRPSTDWRRFGQPELDFRSGHCLLSCVRCTLSCPTDALEPLLSEQKPHLHIGLAKWQSELCLRVSEKEDCSACVRKCPVQAIKLVGEVPVVDERLCIGCGACEHVCPARPLPAIQVNGLSEQRKVVPMAESDLVAEMYRLVEDGESLVLARDGVIFARKRGKGIAPILEAYDLGQLKGAIVVDKVIGRAAAAICRQGGVKKVFATLAGEGAAELLAQAGIEFSARQTVPLILNRERKGSCPMEAAVKGIDDPAAMVEKIRSALRRL